MHHALLVGVGDLCLCASFGIIENIAVELLLGESFIDQCMCWDIPNRKKRRPFALETSGDHYDEDGEELNIRQY